MQLDPEYDVIVVGAGGSGLAAACSAAERGARVLVIEKRSRPGGTTGIAVGSFTACGTEWQRRAGVTDRLKWHVADAGKFADPQIEARNNAELREYFLAEAAASLQWLEGMGVHFVGPHPEPPNRAPRMHNVVPDARAYIATLERRLARYGGQLITSARVCRLEREPRRISAVVVEGPHGTGAVRARRGVILACGDYAANAALIAQYKGERFAAIEGINPDALGEGHCLAASVDAELVNMDVTYGPELRFVAPPAAATSSRLPAAGWPANLIGRLARRLPLWTLKPLVRRKLVTWQHPENSLFDDGAVLLNRQGHRFVNETRWPDREIAVAEQTGKTAYLLLDRRLIERYSKWPHFISTAPDIAYAYAGDYERLRPDVTFRGANFTAAARHAGLPPDAILAAVAQFNDYVAGRRDDPFGRRGDREPLADGPCLLLGPVKAYFTTTEGGARVNRRLEVLDSAGQVIPGLYAVGQNGLGGLVLWGHGLHIAWAITSGRLAGQAIMDGP